MKKKSNPCSSLASFWQVLVTTILFCVVAATAMAATAELSQGWVFRSQTGFSDSGTNISKTGYSTNGWYPITVPSTVMAGLVANGVYSNVFFGTNLQAVPDLTTNDWWYRGEFYAPTNPGGHFWLRFKGIAYRAKIWLNGGVVDTNSVGTLVTHEYNVTSLIRAGTNNALAVLVTPPSSHNNSMPFYSGGTNLSFCYVDWNPSPPDMNAGLWNKVLLDATGPVALRDAFVQTILPLPATNSAKLTMYVDAVNGSGSSVTGALSGVITKVGYPTINFATNITFTAGQRREITFNPTNFTQLQVTNPVLWWPIPLGNPELYNLQLTFTVNGQASASDTNAIDFGIRQITDYLTPLIYGNTYRGYQVNGQNVLIRGSDYVWDLFLRWNSTINQTHINYARDMRLNMIRFEGILGNEELYADADRAGILLMPGYVCCSYWSQYASWSAEDNLVATNSLSSQMRLLRAHPSAGVWAYGSDELPAASILTLYKTISTNLHWQNPTLDSLASYQSTNAGTPKMNGPYAWEPPVYWYATNFWRVTTNVADTAKGGAYGFCAEQGGEVVPPEESLRKFLAPADLWPIGGVYDYHARPNWPEILEFYSLAVNNRYGIATNVTQYADRAQLLNYESERAQFEAFGANAYTLAQGTIYWMLNNAWPSVHYSLYDYFFKPGGAYFGAKKALEPVHILYDYNTANVKVFNATLINASDLTASVKVYNIPDLTLKYTNQVTMNFPANTSTPVFTIPVLNGLSTSYFIRLQLKDVIGQPVSENLYWYSIMPDQLMPDPYSSTAWYYMAVTNYADLTGLDSFPANTNLSATVARAVTNGQETVNVALTNSSATNIAFFVRAEITAGNAGPEVLPVIYSDNYVTLWPGESKTISANYTASDLGGQTPYIRLRGYNVPETDLPGSPPIVLTMRISAPNTVQLFWNSMPGLVYQPEYTTNLMGGTWNPLGSQVVGDGFADSATDPGNSTSIKYYRIRQVQ